MNGKWIFAVLLTIVSVAADAAADKSDEIYVFSSAPRGSREAERAVYEPIAAFLTQQTGKTFRYEWSDNWLTYQKRMLSGEFDLVLDGPHFAGWRIATNSHEPILKMGGVHVFLVISKHSDQGPPPIERLAGRAICAHAPPNLATLTLAVSVTHSTTGNCQGESSSVWTFAEG